MVVNLSERELTTDEKSALVKGGNYAVTPKQIRTEDTMSNIETAIRALPEEAVDTIRMETSRILRIANIPKHNLYRGELKALKDLKSDESVLIMQADKGNATLVMSTENHNKKIEELFDHTRAKEGSNTSFVTEDQHFNEKVKFTKIYTNNIPLRSIVSSIGLPSYNLAKHLTNYFNHILARFNMIRV